MLMPKLLALSYFIRCPVIHPCQNLGIDVQNVKIHLPQVILFMGGIFNGHLYWGVILVYCDTVSSRHAFCAKMSYLQKKITKMDDISGYTSFSS